jgi:hypothetical protein
MGGSSLCNFFLRKIQFSLFFFWRHRKRQSATRRPYRRMRRNDRRKRCRSTVISTFHYRNAAETLQKPLQKHVRGADRTATVADRRRTYGDRTIQSAIDRHALQVSVMRNMPAVPTVRRSPPIFGVHTAIGECSQQSIGIHCKFSQCFVVTCPLHKRFFEQQTRTWVVRNCPQRMSGQHLLCSVDRTAID